MGLIAPMMFQSVPYWAQVSLFIFGGALVLAGTATMLLPRRKKPERDQVSVSMGDRNAIGQIGHSIDVGRKEGR